MAEKSRRLGTVLPKSKALRETPFIQSQLAFQRPFVHTIMLWRNEARATEQRHEVGREQTTSLQKALSKQSNLGPCPAAAIRTSPIHQQSRGNEAGKSEETL